LHLLIESKLEIVDQALIFDNSEGNPLLIAEKNFGKEMKVFSNEKYSNFKNHYEQGRYRN
jgi:predicted ABC-type ATPase